MLETFNAFVTKINGFVWGPVMLILLVGTHVYLTFRTRIIQRKTITAIKLSVTPDSEASGDVSGFGALATALAATIGTGNIVGVATAIGAGGPGAVFSTGAQRSGSRGEAEGQGSEMAIRRCAPDEMERTLSRRRFT